ncbi:hypothetical protein AVEN_108227-1 [Araneus ventricosus]|uniref:PiggyBac transposable element-derived protein domain-containing protein n=1 Tax=Araneus ventricosus TaxID=182803 RepID=A0A4Y2RXN0_ARAVE|nr:hypothetical protein AVEN_108227-1 [Araneus ventricosus]
MQPATNVTVISETKSTPLVASAALSMSFPPLGEKRVSHSRKSDADAAMSSSSASEGDTLEYNMSEDLEDLPAVISPPPSSKPGKANKYKNREMEKVASDEDFYLIQKLDPLMTDMKKNFKSHFNPCQNMSVDEPMIKYKGRLGIIQYMPKKPTKRGIKIWMLCDSSFGYVYDFDDYCGKKDKIPRRCLPDCRNISLLVCLLWKEMACNTASFNAESSAWNTVFVLDNWPFHWCIGMLMWRTQKAAPIPSSVLEPSVKYWIHLVSFTDTGPPAVWLT